MIQYLIVGVIVALACLSSAWMLMPSGWRRAAAAKLAVRAVRSGVHAHTVIRIQSRLEGAGSCSDCSSCRGCSTGQGRISKQG